MLPCKIIENSPLAPYCSMKTGGNAKYICLPENIAQLKAVLSYMKAKGIPVLVLGNASNTLFSDGGYDGAVVFTTRLNRITVNGQLITAECGASLSSVALTAAKLSLSGLEFSYGIPGTVGGGVFMNAGAYGSELSDCFTEAICLNPLLEEVCLSSEEMCFSYRKSVLSGNNYVLLSAAFSLMSGEGSEIREKMEHLMRQRKEKQPLDCPSCGSTFKRPQGHFAGALIEQCGLKGYAIGNAAVSEKHAGFIINKGNAAADDIIKLIDYVSDIVYEKTGVRLEPEIRIIRQR